MRRYVAGFYVNRDLWSVALVTKAKPAWQKGRKNAIGGKIEAGETPAEAMHREFGEETGVDVTDWKPTVILCGDDFEVHFFIAEGEPSRCKQQEDEEIGEYYIGQLPDTCIPNIFWLLPLSMDRDIKFPLRVRDVGKAIVQPDAQRDGEGGRDEMGNGK
jgi:8-oxo-dGTP diphosphatase